MENNTALDNKTLNAISQIEELIKSCKDYEEQFRGYLEKVHPDYSYSAQNLIHYLAYRNKGKGELKTFLFNNGLSGLKNAERHVMASLLATKWFLLKLSGGDDTERYKPELSIKKGASLLSSHTRELLGDRSRRRSVYIMVTQPETAAKDPEIIREMLEKGMNTLRINCAHDTEKEWLDMIRNAREAMRKTGKMAKITMDLGGPKIRTGSIKSGPKVVHLSPERNNKRQNIYPAQAILFPEGALYPDEENTYIHVPQEMIDLLKTGDKIQFKDIRNKKRTFKVTEKKEKMVWVNCSKNSYLETGLKLKVKKHSKTFRIGEIPPLEQYILLKKGDIFTITKEQVIGEPAQYGPEGSVIKNAHISCTSPDVFNDVKKGESVVFDDGKISGIIIENTGDEIHMEIVNARADGVKLKSDKGINFPDSNLNLSGLTDKDRKDLEFVVNNADVVNMSFVNTSRDVEDLLNEIDKHNALGKVGIILKIETLSGFNNIVKILLTAMQTKPVGVMIARGDLAIEAGWDKIGIFQEELLKICHAGHIPSVWATQVMENLAKKGVPSRAEITDAVMSQNADCVMLNKGIYISQAIELLDTILINSEILKEDKTFIFKNAVIME